MRKDLRACTIIAKSVAAIPRSLTKTLKIFCVRLSTSLTLMGAYGMDPKSGFGFKSIWAGLFPAT